MLWLARLLKFASIETIAEAVGMDIGVLKNLASGSYLPTSALTQEFKSVYGSFNYQRIRSYGVSSELANSYRYADNDKVLELQDKIIRTITNISYRNEVDPNIIMNGLRNTDYTLEELEERYSNEGVPEDYFSTVKNDILYY